ncbi:MAG: hypothetical protein IKD94_01320 [Erysipelotrichaceae bacterium]|nr:hypothetical protein [Erysipelotrichaceae bacterium]
MVKAELTMRANSLNMDTKVTVLLPEDRKETKDLRGKKYPVLYILHGYKEDCSAWLNLSNIFLLCRDLDLIVVMPSANNSCYNNSKYGQNYYDWIAEELPVKLRNYFPISDRREDTFIMGESMGGYGTLRIALSKPDKYGKAVCLSGANMAKRETIHKDMEPFLGTREEMLTSDANIENLIRKIKERNLDCPELRIYCGNEDFIFADCRKITEKLEEAFPDKVRHEYWKGEHNFFFWNEANPKALSFFGFDVKGNSVI